MQNAALSILLVLDSQDTIADIEKIFAKHNPASTLNVTRNLAEARDFLSQETPDIALVNYRLSDGTAPELKGEGSLLFPVILLIEDEQPALAEQANLTGFFEHLRSNQTTIASLTELLPLHRRLWIQQNKLDQAERLAKLGFWDWDDIENRLSDCSEGYARLLEMTKAEVMANFCTNEQDQRAFHPDDVARYLEAEATEAARGKGVDIEYRIITASGRIRHIHEICEVTVDDAGRFISSSGILQDITDRKLAQEKLTSALANARRAERLVKLGTYEWDWVKGGLVACSEEYARILELSASDALKSLSRADADHSLIGTPEHLVGRCEHLKPRRRSPPPRPRPPSPRDIPRDRGQQPTGPPGLLVAHGSPQFRLRSARPVT